MIDVFFIDTSLATFADEVAKLVGNDQWTVDKKLVKGMQKVVNSAQGTCPCFAKIFQIHGKWCWLSWPFGRRALYFIASAIDCIG